MTDRVLQNKFSGFDSASLLIFNVSGNSSGPFIKLRISAVKEIRGQGGDIARGGGVVEGFFCVVLGRSEIRLENEAFVREDICKFCGDTSPEVKMGNRGTNVPDMCAWT